MVLDKTHCNGLRETHDKATIRGVTEQLRRTLGYLIDTARCSIESGAQPTASATAEVVVNDAARIRITAACGSLTPDSGVPVDVSVVEVCRCGSTSLLHTQAEPFAELFGEYRTANVAMPRQAGGTARVIFILN